jgi:integrase/recombinase XerC
LTLAPVLALFRSMPDKKPGVEELLHDYLSRESATTVRHYQGALDDFARFVKADGRLAAAERLLGAGFAAGNELVIGYRRDMEGTRDADGKLKAGRGLSASAVNLRLTVLRGLVKKARRHGLIDWELDVPNIASENVHEVTGPGIELLNRMLEAAKAQPGPLGRRNYAILRLAGELGLRRKEIVGLDFDDVDLIAGTVRIRGKARRQLEKLSCTPVTVEALSRWMEVRPRPRDGRPLFTNLIPGRPTRLTGSAVYELVRGLGRDALPKGSRRRVRPHGIRHTAITEAVRRAKEVGLAREEVQKFSRHRDFRMVARYLDAHDQAQKRLGAAVGEALP